MEASAFRWLLDVDLPHVASDDLDALHVQDFDRLPGHAGLTEAKSLGRTLVTANLDFAGAWQIPGNHPGVVMFEAPPHDRESLERNLHHVQFRLRQYGRSLTLAGNRFLVKTDCTMEQLLPDGRQVRLEPWRTVRAPVLAAT
ncbi:MAG: hypothetical protein FJ318_02080 [SAR202 cluster bacterium]|nr:hypothetical protein [SAR202 cluster bacterium]